jgi:hypothetical protein
MLSVGTNILLHLVLQNNKSRVVCCWFITNVKILLRFEGQRQSIENYGRQHGQDSQEKHEFKSLSVDPALRQAAAPADDDDDVDLFGDEDEEESEQTKQRLAAYAEKKSKSKLFEKNNLHIFNLI